MVYKLSARQPCVYSGPEPKSTNPDPLTYEQLLFAHLAKVIQTHFTEDSYIQQFLTLSTECILTIILNLLLIETCLHLSRGRVSKMVFSLRHKHIA